MPELKVVGIDPGKSGCVAFLEGQDVVLHSCPIILNGKKREYDERAMASIIKNAAWTGTKMIFMEKVHAMPGQGVTSMFSFGQGFGIWLGILSCFDIPYELVSPQRWKRDMMADIPGEDNKAKSIIAAKILFPQANIKWKKDHNLAEALLIAEWGRRRLSV
jgi:hypothetical protein